MKKGDIVSCEKCGHRRPIVNPVIEMFGDEIGFGPGGETDMFVKRDRGIVCQDCIEEEIEIP